MKRLLKLPVVLGVGAAALTLGGVAAATAGGARSSIRPAAPVSADSPSSTDATQTGDVQPESTDAQAESTDATQTGDVQAESTDATDAPKTNSGAPTVESDVNDGQKDDGEKDDGEKDDVDDGTQHDAQDETGDHHDESAASNAVRSSGSTAESTDDHGRGHKGD